MEDIFKTSIEPTSFHVLVKQDIIEEPEVEEKTKGGIFIPLSAKEKLQREKEREQGGVFTGVLIAAGPTAWKGFDDGTPWAKAGDHVIYARYAGFVIEDSETGEEYQIMNDEDIKGVFKAKGENNG